MLVDLQGIIGVPGGKVAFEFEPDMSEVAGGSILRADKPAKAVGNVVNRAGVLMFSATVDAEFVCVCAKCLKEFEYPVHKQISVFLTQGGEGEDPDGYLIEGDKIDAAEIIVTEFILDIDDRLLCSEDCAGLCQNCGSDLNNEPCSCEKEIDPRLAVLKQLLDNE